MPLIPAGVARLQVHGMPRKRGIFGAEARIQREMRTVQLISRQILATIPAARLINGLQSPADNSHIDHAVLAGYRLAIIGSMLLPPGAYAWNGSTLTHGGRSVAPPQLAHVVRRMQDIFPELNVTGWIVVHSTDGNLHQPVIDRHRRAPGGQGSGYGEGSGLVEVVNAAGLARGLKTVPQLGTGPQHGQRSRAGAPAGWNALGPVRGCPSYRPVRPTPARRRSRRSRRRGQAARPTPAAR